MATIVAVKNSNALHSTDGVASIVPDSTRVSASVLVVVVVVAFDVAARAVVVNDFETAKHN